jgi:hypothetical protein
MVDYNCVVFAKSNDDPLSWNDYLETWPDKCGITGNTRLEAMALCMKSLYPDFYKALIGDESNAIIIPVVGNFGHSYLGTNGAYYYEKRLESYCYDDHDCDFSPLYDLHENYWISVIWDCEYWPNYPKAFIVPKNKDKPLQFVVPKDKQFK